jgi:phage-related protein
VQPVPHAHHYTDKRKPVEFVGDSLERLREFPKTIRRLAGLQLDRVQRGLDAVDWKPLPQVGRGVREIRVRDDTGTYRVVYVATFGDMLYVLHCFEKKTRTMPKRALDLAIATLSRIGSF